MGKKLTRKEAEKLVDSMLTSREKADASHKSGTLIKHGSPLKVRGDVLMREKMIQKAMEDPIKKKKKMTYRYDQTPRKNGK
jgi:hypothetical protein